ncbi:unnamed protein product (macronuclear) [Paramecium tetraurelia]|uniref:Protein kinase domain-containing protein n=1 Tax=Paramecium tetraurelia TaxID=5888 RepID=A0DZK8_PARTE|nr:uncharacterized protein GSPATT00021643001 [Paramecium tetraurelia]CAK88475.1 unnamed protein product [Paramecium tetraurelia]|eukprot:XP_001455872.1 hypothetical protein (macronuclear) [Paramecium tetraurelia strain d4-2]
MESQLKFICIRQHMFLDQKYVLLLLPSKITLSQFGKEPKYILELKLHSIISWQLNHQNQLVSFGIIWNRIEKLFHSTHEDLMKLREAIKNQIMFKTVHQLYKPLSLLGGSNLDELYLCSDLIDNKQFQIKCHAKNQFEDSMSRIYNEIQCLNKIKSDYVQRLHEVFTGENTVYLIQEYLDGVNLNELLNRVTLDKPQILIIMKQLLTAVKQIHSQNIMHRDLKPTAIVFQNKDSIEGLKLTDFHLAVPINSQINLSDSGTPGYAAPETFKDNYNEKVDIFSVGCIFFKLVTKRDLFYGKTTNEILKLNRTCKIDLQILQIYKLSQNELNLLKDLLELDPEKRISAESALSHPYFNNDTIQEEQLVNNQQQPLLVQNLLERSNGFFQAKTDNFEKNVEEFLVDSESPNICAVPIFKVLMKDSIISNLQVRKKSKLKKSETQEYSQLNFLNHFQTRKSVHQTIV